MQTLIMISNNDITVTDLMETLPAKYAPISLGPAGFVIQRNRENRTTAYVRVRKLDNPAAEYDGSDSPPFPVGPETRGFLIEFNDLALLKEVAPLLADRNDVAIDDDHGNIVLGSDFVTGIARSNTLGWLPSDYKT